MRRYTLPCCLAPEAVMWLKHKVNIHRLPKVPGSKNCNVIKSVARDGHSAEEPQVDTNDGRTSERERTSAASAPTLDHGEEENTGLENIGLVF
jgi:hypothetical protein